MVRTTHIKVTAPEPSVSLCYKATPDICSIEQEIHRKLNLLRMEHGKKELQQDFGIAYVGRIWSVQQANRGTISHEGFPYQRNKDLQDEFHRKDLFISRENVCRIHVPDQLTDSASWIADKLIETWRKSPGHLKNMLADNLAWHGTGVVLYKPYAYATQLLGYFKTP